SDSGSVHPDHWVVRRFTNAIRGSLRLPRWMDYRSLGPAAFLDVVQRALAGWIPAGAGLAALAGVVRGGLFVPRMECILASDHLRHGGDQFAIEAAYDG